MLELYKNQLVELTNFVFLLCDLSFLLVWRWLLGVFEVWIAEMAAFGLWILLLNFSYKYRLKLLISI